MLRVSIAILIALGLTACNDGTPPPEQALVEAPPAVEAVQTPTAPDRPNYPETRKVEHVDDYNGVAVEDPYRWLEDLDGEETAEWIEAQNAVTLEHLSALPQREPLKTRLTELWNYERYSIPFKRGGRYFFERNDGLQNQDVLYTLDRLDAEPRVLLDPNTFSEDGTVALFSTEPSPDGSLLAYSTSTGGSDWREWHVVDVTSGEKLDDHLQWSKFSGASWAADGSGFYYARYDEPQGENELKAVNYFHKLYFHRIGTPQSEDVLVYERPDQKEWGFGAEVTDDGRYLVIQVWMGTDTRNLLFYKDLSRPDSDVVELIDEFTNAFEFVGNDGSTFFVNTDQDADRYRVIAIDVERPEAEHWREVVAETDDAIRSVTYVNHQIVVNYLHDASTLVRVHDGEGTLVREVELPGIGSAFGFDGEADDKETFYSFTSFTTPSTIHRYDLATGESSVFREPKVDFDASGYVTEQVFYESKDGTRIPMFIVSRKGIEKLGNNATLLYGYGGFNISQTPGFSVSRAAWLEMGGVYAVANLRGGGEYGKLWHEAGTKTRKQNVFDDFIAAAEYLIESGYTQPAKLAIQGGSNGGLLVGATMIQRPELFAVALPAVGVMDMLRFNQFTIGWAWESDYGSPQNPEEFAALRAYSPLHNLKPGTDYPATLVTTADHDDRVFPAHSFKFAAALQAAHSGNDPVLIRVQTKAGHGAGKPTAMIIEEQADIYAFAAYHTGLKPAG